jgi:uncharacterized protein
MIPNLVFNSDLQTQKNVFGENLLECSKKPLTGFFRTGCCETAENDAGGHTVCAQVTEAFLEFSKRAGNDLSTQNPFFPGLKPGDKWCLCASRWLESYVAGCAPRVFLKSTNLLCLELIPFDVLEPFGVE